MDPLSEILRSARLSGGVFLRGEFTEPWCLASAINASDCTDYLGPADHLVLYHYVVEGELTVDLAGPTVASFLPGQAAILPRNDPHRLSGRRAAEAVSALDVARIPKPGELMVIEHGGGGDGTRIVCGFLGGKGLAGDPLLSALPPLMVYDSSTARSGGFVRESLEFAAREVADGRLGSDAMLARISEMLFVEAVRSYVDALPPEADGWIKALRDRSLSRALALIHRYPEKPWTVETLGRAVGASRSTLADKFTRYFDTAPVEYLTQHRMRLAARKLMTDAAPIVVIAASVGYGSEAAFSRAFKRHFNASPSAWRDNAAEGNTVPDAPS